MTAAPAERTTQRAAIPGQRAPLPPAPDTTGGEAPAKPTGIDTPPPFTGWTTDRAGIRRYAPVAFHARQAAAIAALQAVTASKPKPRPPKPVDLGDFTFAEMLAAHAAHCAARRRTGPPLTDRQNAARLAYRRARDHGLLPSRGRARPSVDAILELVGVGMDLPGIAEARGTIPKRILEILRDAGRHDVIAGLQAIPGKPRASTITSDDRSAV